MTDTATAPPRFSVLMNVYNGAAYVCAAIDSLLAQTCQDWELIIWDDKSADDTVAVCRTYTDPRIRMFASEINVGLGAARNATMALATGDWVAFLDQDDIWTPDKLAGQDALIRADRSGRLGLVYGRTQRFDDTGPIGWFDPWYGGGTLPEGEIFNTLFAQPSFIANSSIIFKRTALQALLPVPENIRYCTDYYLCLHFARAYSIACMQTLCCHYRVHPASMTTVFRREVHEEIMHILASVAQPSQRRTLIIRRLVHETWIGVAELRSGQVSAGLWRIIRHGSVAYLVLRPLVVLLRKLRESLRQP